MIEGREISFAAYLVLVAASGFIITGCFVLLSHWRTFLQWGIELMRPLVSFILVVFGSAMRDTGWMIEKISQKTRRLGLLILYKGIDVRNGRSEGGAF